MATGIPFLKELSLNQLPAHGDEVGSGLTDLYAKSDGLFIKTGNDERKIGEIDALYNFDRLGHDPRIVVKNANTIVDNTKWILRAEDKDGNATGLDIQLNTGVSNTISMLGSSAVISVPNTTFKIRSKNVNTIKCDAGKVGLDNTDPINTFDCPGGVAIGPNYAGSETAPGNGMIVEGRSGFGGADPNVHAHFFKGVAYNHQNKSVDYTIAITDNYLSFSGENLTATLPDAAVVHNSEFTIVNLDETNLTIDTNGGKISGNANRSIPQWSCIVLRSGGSNYHIISYFNGTI